MPRRPTPPEPTVVVENGEVWQVNLPGSRPERRRRLLGFIGHRETAAPPHYPTAGWWASAGVHGRQTGLATEQEALDVLAEANDIDYFEVAPATSTRPV